jgi:6-phosphogluconolactonase (cycloisomerase 2 family)
VLNIDFSGQYLYSAGLDSGYVSLFKILKNGNLEFVDRYEVGSEPMWIEIVNIED